MEQQSQSPLFRLPIELREQIYQLALTAERPFTDPRIGPLIRSPYTDRPPLGVAILRTCQRVYAEVDISFLYLHNTLRFTSPKLISAFLDRLPPKHRHLLSGITCDLRTLNPSDALVGGAEPLAEWTHYLHCTRDRHPRLLACRRFDDVLQLHIPPPRLKWVAFDVTTLQQQIGVVPERLALSSSDIIRGRQVTTLGRLGRRCCAFVIESQRHTSGSDEMAGLEMIKIRALDVDGNVEERCMCVGTGSDDDDVDGLLMFDIKTGRLRRAVGGSIDV